MEGRRWRDRRSRARRRGAKRRSAEGGGSGEGRRSPSPVWGSAGYAPRKIFKKSILKSRIFGPHKLDTPPKNSLPGCTGEGVDTLIPQTQILVLYMKFRKPPCLLPQMMPLLISLQTSLCATFPVLVVWVYHSIFIQILVMGSKMKTRNLE